MNTRPIVSVIVSSCQRKRHLERCLLSFANQNIIDQAFEAIVADDGSSDGTHAMVEAMAPKMPYQLSIISQPKNGFRKSLIVNQAIARVRSDYVILTDGDCLFPPDHLAKQLQHRKQNVAWVSDCIRLEQGVSIDINRDSVARGQWLSMVPSRLPRHMRVRFIKDRSYQAFGHSMKPKLIGNNFGVWLSDLEKINGFDASFKGWGAEDDDLGLRLRAAGVKIKTNLNRTFGYHLWHPADPTTPAKIRQGDNVAYFERPIVLARCLNGIKPKKLPELNFHVAASAQYGDLAELLKKRFTCKSPTNIDIQIQIGKCDGAPNQDAEKTIQIQMSDENTSPAKIAPNLILTIPKTLVNDTDAIDGEQTTLANDDEPQEAIQCDWIVAQIRNAILGNSSSIEPALATRAA